MISFRPISIAAAAVALMFVPASTTLAQRQQASPEQRIDRLERQVQQMQRQVFPKGRPADTAGFADDPAASQSSVVSLDQRLDALERQMTDILRLSEENGHVLRTMQSDLAQARSDNDARMSAIEQRIAVGALDPTPVPAATEDPVVPPKPRPVPIRLQPSADSATTGDGAADPGELAYTEGYQAWEAGRYDEAIASLRAFISDYPGHRRVSFANNLVGRSLLDKGDPQAATKALLANYRDNPKGARAPDSLYYLGQARMRLGQPGQACKAYAELDAVYGAKIRPDLKKLEMEAKTEARC